MRLYASAAGPFFEFLNILIEPLGLSPEGLLLLAGSLMSPLAVKRRMVSISGDPGLPLIQEPWMIAYLLIFEEDLYPVP